MTNPMMLTPTTTEPTGSTNKGDSSQSSSDKLERDYLKEARYLVQHLEDASEPLLYEEYSIPLLILVLEKLAEVSKRLLTVEEEIDLMRAGN